ncbi:LacI family DNA-binding transcriptional regulator [Prauserella cavernicola]|uniref:LacI family DNA-binding transcriptional regulator n=1 Tax=Prauserella cavernicola TaxID=2800127 RepID=A0A934QVC8_9PSEU|nr:LacI family DNA-binding transcriptional regulator [Prauserella cavernicola]MBK1787036.1 LacI family DNA-binding transcriptional regulator [Prauserella cavernicola]
MRADEPVNLIAVAKAAGVSKTTASDALRNSGRVSERTREHVVAVATRLGYSPNPVARSLRMSSTGTIGLHLPEVLTRSEYYMSFVFGVVDQAAKRDYDVTLLTAHHVSSRRFHRVDGVVLGDPLETDTVVRGLLDSSVPAVTCERFTGDAEPAGVVLSDHAAMLDELLEHLHSAGARDIALLASSTVTDWGRTLQQVYLRWCEQRGLRPRLREMAFGSPTAVMQDNVRALLNADPAVDALVCAPDGSASAVLPVLRAAGRTIGEDLLLASCVDSTALNHTDPPITAIDLRPREAGAACAQLLFDVLSGEAPKGTVRAQPIGLARRRSTRG